jgi:ubiquinone biosynthesis protein
MSISLPRHLKRYKDIALLLLRHGNSEFLDNLEQRAALLDEAESPEGRKSPEELARDLEEMGPTFVKLGQILSSRADLLPAPYLRALSRLQDKVKPFPPEQVEEIVEKELGVRISKAFSSFEREPLAAASLGQVHQAVLRDGRKVVVKVQRPGIRRQIAEDLQVLEEIIEFLDDHSEAARQYQFRKIFDEFQRTLIQELDYLREVSNMDVLGRNLREFDNIVVPLPIHDYTTRSVLTMERIEGTKITDIGGIVRLDFNGGALADELFKAYLKQVLIDGIFHADPHPGNVFLTPEHRVALLDLGMVGRVTPDMQERLIKLLLAISEGDAERAVREVVAISQTTNEFDEQELRRGVSSLIGEQRENTLANIDVGRVVLEVGRIAGENGLYVPTQLTMLGKTLLQLDEIGRTLDPQFNPTEAIRRHVSDILSKNLSNSANSSRVYTSLLELKDFVGGLPNRINRILDAVGNSELELNVKANDIHLLLEGFQKIANRITTGLVLAALIVGAALLMQVQTPFRILGYPGLAILCFLAAAGGGVWLICNILFSDQKTKRKARRH